MVPAATVEGPSEKPRAGVRVRVSGAPVPGAASVGLAHQAEVDAVPA
ncbi:MULTISPECIES: hypothetical protein [Streptomyces]|uniref:Uncharacterized protein n=1 Tax=Streptomyces flavovirens TaxID=52258 RepID=A0ABV8MYT8_9ACTN|nr:hypothetical protein [Streptomyces sp. MBT51]